MDAYELGLWSIPALIGLILLRAPIGLAMLVMGIGGMWVLTGSPTVFLARLKTEAYSSFSNYTMSIIPLFLLMGHFATMSQMSQKLFRAAGAVLGHRRGGIAMAAVGACAGFGAICGSSLATAATMARVALPQMKAHGYSGGFSTATLAAGGTLGILIPPSFILVIYAMLTEQNIARLFLAALVPGALAAVGYIVVIALYVRRHPEEAGTNAPMPGRERLRVILEAWPVFLTFGLVIFGIAGDWNWSKPGVQALFTPTEGASIGAMATGVFALVYGGMTRKSLAGALEQTAISSAMIFFIVLGAGFYNGFLAMTQVPQHLALWVEGSGFGPYTVLVIILLVYLIFGCLMDSLSMILLTVPIFWPMIQHLDFGLPADDLAIWFGILVLLIVEVGLITPPVGLNLFIINSMDESKTPIAATYRCIWWFITSDLVRVTLLVIFPSITLFLAR